MTRQRFAIVGFVCYAVFFAASFIGTAASFALFAVCGASAITAAIMRKAAAALALTAAAASFLIYGAYSLVFIEPCAMFYDKEYDMTAEVERADRYSNDTMCVTISGTAEGTPVRVSFYCPDIQLLQGDIISVTVRLRKPSYSASYGESYSYSRGIFLSAAALSEPAVVGKSTDIKLGSVISDYSQYLRAKASEFLTNDEYGLLKAMFFGDNSSLSVKLSAAVRKSGVSHLTAVSGLHLTLIVQLFTGIFGTLGIFGRGHAEKLKFFISATLSAVFIVFFDLSASVIRSTIMLLICSSAPLFRRKSQPLNSLGTALLVILLVKPCACRDAGLLLTVSATVGVGYLAPMLCEHLKFKLTRAFVTGLCACAATIPACIVCFGGFSVLSPVTTLLLHPFFVAALVCTVLFSVTGGAFGEALLFPAGLALKAAEFIIELAAKIPYSYISVGSRLFLVLFGLFTIAVTIFVLCSPKERRRKRLIGAATASLCTIIAVFTAENAAVGGLTKISVFPSSKGCVLTIEDSSGIYGAVCGYGKGLSRSAADALTNSGHADYRALGIISDRKYREAYREGVLSLGAEQVYRYTDGRLDISTESGILSFSDDSLKASINGLTVSFSSMGALNESTDIIIASGYRKELPFKGSRLTVVCDKRYPEDGSGMINAYYSTITIYIDKDGRFYTEKE